MIFKDNRYKPEPDSDFEALYSRMFDPLSRYAERFFPDKDESCEIVQTVMVRLLERPDTFSKVDCPEKFLYKTVYNECINRLSNQKVQNRYKDYNRLRLVEIEMENFEETYQQSEISNLLRLEIERLPKHEKALVQMRFVQGLKYAEIASEVHLSSRTVETYLQKIVKKFRIRLRGRGLILFL